jgi:maltose alpha-D-glucosyltransferase/alpha-amylase
MYRVYANDAKARINLGIRRRLAPLLGSDRGRIELLHLLLFSSPGTPFLYYGDEIGMGDNIFLGDRNGVRTPMQWSPDKNAGFSRASPHALYLPIILDPEYHYEAVNVETQQRNPYSLWWWMKRVLTLRKRYRAFGRGSIRFLEPENRKILAFVRQYENETILVIANLSRFAQPARLDLAEFKQTLPVELFGRAEFPPITEEPYVMTLNPHAAFWFLLEPVTGREYSMVSIRAGQTLKVENRWEDILRSDGDSGLEACLLSYIKGRRWFGGKGREVKAVLIRDAIPLPRNSALDSLLFLEVDYVEGDPEQYLLAVSFAAGAEREQIEKDSPQRIIAHMRLERQNAEGILYAATASKPFCQALFEAITRRRSFSGSQGELKTVPTPVLRAGGINDTAALEPVVRQAEQNNTSVFYGDKYFLKLFRRLEVGTNPDLEIGRFLTEQRFPNIAPVAGSIEYKRRNGELVTAGILTEVVPNAKDAWDFTLDTLSRYFERVRTAPAETLVNPLAGAPLLKLAQQEPPESVVALIGTYLEAARLLGQRTGEMHLALASAPEDRIFAPEPFTPFYQRALFQSMRNLAVQNLQLLRRRFDRVPALVRPQAEKVVGLESAILKCLRAVYETRMTARRIRCHGDFHLGQVLYTGKDFVIIDFEGEPARPMGERRIKRSPLRDVAGMIRSFDYVTYAALVNQLELGNLQEEHLPELEPWTGFWYRWVSAVYLRAYLDVLQESDLLPRSKSELSVLLDAHLLEKAVYEIGYEINNRPAWVKIPLRGVLQLIENKGDVIE